MKYLLVLLCLVFMIFFIKEEHEEKYVLAVVLKGLASLCFVLFGFLLSKENDFSRLVKIGLILGLIADLFLNLRFVFEKKGKIIFLVGILIFLMGHVMYLWALVPRYSEFVFTILGGLIASVVILKWIFSQITAEKAFKVFGVFYIGVIVLMNAFALRNVIYEQSGSNLIFALGAISFLFSDIVLILNTFGKETKFSLRITNLTLYYIGQLLIAFSLSLL